LVVSVLLNVFVLGWVSVRVVRHQRGAQEHQDAAMPSAARRLWQEHAPSFRAERRLIFERRQAVAEALRQEPFDRGELEAKLLELRNATSERDLQLHRVLVELAAQLTPDDRQRLSRSPLLMDGGARLLRRTHDIRE
jgi:uncharacterized membrane protein